MSIAVGVKASGGSDGGGGAAVTEKNILTGDTLFPGSCGRIDLPESDKAEMFKSLQNVLRNLPPSMVVWPGVRAALCTCMRPLGIGRLYESCRCTYGCSLCGTALARSLLRSHWLTCDG